MHRLKDRHDTYMQPLHLPTAPTAAKQPCYQEGTYCANARGTSPGSLRLLIGGPSAITTRLCPGSWIRTRPPSHSANSLGMFTDKTKIFGTPPPSGGDFAQTFAFAARVSFYLTCTVRFLLSLRFPLRPLPFVLLIR